MTMKAWSLAVAEAEPLTETDARYPLATRNGMTALYSFLVASAAWRQLTKPQRELLLSCVAGYPILPRADVKARVVAHGLIDEQLQATAAGRLLVQLRPNR